MKNLIAAILILVFSTSCTFENNRTDSSGSDAGTKPTASEQTDTLQIRAEEATQATIAIYDRILND